MSDEIKIICLPLNHLEPTGEDALTKEDVWGTYNHKTHEKLSDGMIVARHKQKCPYFHDIIGYKSVTVKGPLLKREEISYWLEHVHGAGAIAMELVEGDFIIIRSDYQCW